MAALAPLGLSAIAVGLSLGAAAGGVLGLVYVVRVMAVSKEDVIREVWPPLVAALTMAAIMTPVEFLLVQAADHGTVVGLLLLAAEAIAAIAIYLAVLAILARDTARELLRGVGSAREAFGRVGSRAPDEEALDQAEAPLPGDAGL
jgi:hypothetical protein